MSLSPVSGLSRTQLLFALVVHNYGNICRANCLIQSIYSPLPRSSTPFMNILLESRYSYSIVVCVCNNQIASMRASPEYILACARVCCIINMIHSILWASIGCEHYSCRDSWPDTEDTQPRLSGAGWGRGEHCHIFGGGRLATMWPRHANFDIYWHRY